MEFLVIGTGRSGTGYMSKLLTSNGKLCGHESIYGLPVNFVRYQSIEKKLNYKGDSSWLAVPFIPQILSINPETTFIHIVRNPIDVIKSFLELDFFNDINLRNSPYVRLISDNINLKGKTQLERAIAYYIGWFEMIESNNIKNKIFLQLENIDYDLLSSTLGVEIKPMNKVINDKKNKKRITLNRKDVKQQIENSSRFLELKEIVKKYNYEL